jgi:hypothetical protein
MKLIPHSHTAAFNWINQAWAFLEITPMETAQLLAQICGFRDWEELANAVSGQSAPTPFCVLTADQLRSMSEKSLEQINVRQQRVLRRQSRLCDHFLEGFLETMSVLKLEAINDNCSKMRTTLPDLLKEITAPGGDMDEELGELFELMEASASLHRQVDPKRYLDFAQAMGWCIDAATFVPHHTPYDVSFYAADNAGRAIPVFIFSLVTEPGDQDDEEAMEIKKRVATLADMAEWERVIVMWGECHVLSDDQEHHITCVGSLLDKNEWLEMFVCASTNTVDALFSLNLQAEKDWRERHELMPYATDVGFFAASAFNTYVRQRQKAASFD